MREILVKKQVQYETDISVLDNTAAFAMAIWCGVHLSKKHELDFENGVARFIYVGDVFTFEKEWGKI
jgi:hypothetical protein